MAALPLSCGDGRAHLKNMKEAQEPASLSNFWHSPENFICISPGNPCGSTTEADLHTKRTGQSDAPLEGANPTELEAPMAATRPKESATAESSQPEGSPAIDHSIGTLDVRRRRSRRGEIEGGGGEEGEEEHHHNPFVCGATNNPSSSKLQFRREVSRARWDKELGMGEVVERKGSMWTTTGIIRNGKLYCHIEEILFLAERGALLLADSDGTTLTIKDIYQKITEGNDGFSWESFEAYRHLKSLGYVVGRHGIPWTMKSNRSHCNSNSLQNTFFGTERSNREVDETMPVIQQFKELELNDMKLTFDVYLPNSEFRKSSPGDPSFLLCLLREYPPSRAEVESVERKCGVLPLKYCFVDRGRVSFFSFDKVSLPLLP